MPFGERVLFAGAMAGGASVSVASSGDNSVSTGLSSDFAVAFVPPFGLALGFPTASLASGLALVSFLSVFLSDDVLLDFSVAGSRIETRSSSPSMTTMASGFSLARMPLAAAAQSTGSPLG